MANYPGAGDLWAKADLLLRAHPPDLLLQYMLINDTTAGTQGERFLRAYPGRVRMRSILALAGPRWVLWSLRAAQHAQTARADKLARHVVDVLTTLAPIEGIVPDRAGRNNVYSLALLALSALRGATGDKVAANKASSRFWRDMEISVENDL